MGRKGAAYAHDLPMYPLQVAEGRSKLLGEQKVLAAANERFYVVRTSCVFGPGVTVPQTAP